MRLSRSERNTRAQCEGDGRDISSGISVVDNIQYGMPGSSDVVIG